MCGTCARSCKMLQRPVSKMHLILIHYDNTVSSCNRVNKFPDKAEFWVEINTVIAALRPDCDNNETDKQFLNDMFKNMSPGKQTPFVVYQFSNRYSV